MKKFICKYTNENEKRFNLGLINREYDDDLVTYIIDCCKSLEVLPNIKFVDYEYITNEADINTSEYIDARDRSKGKKKEQVRYMHLKDSRYGELRLTFDLECKGETATIYKKLLVPVADNNQYYTIKGNSYFLLMQIVDNSTYTTKSSLTLKSMMPVIMKVKNMTYTSTDDIEYEAPTYTVNVFKKDVDILLFYLAKFGIDFTLSYYSVDKIIRFTETVDDEENYIYFSISSKMFIEVDRHYFEKFKYVKSITFMLLNICTNRLSYEILYDKHHWIEVIGGLGTTNKNGQFEKGMNTLTFFDRIIDNTTKRILKVHPIHKENIYSILRWMIMNFDTLKKKDNMSLENKRLRCNELTISSYVQQCI